MRATRVIATILIVAATAGVAGTVISATACKSRRGETLRTGPLYQRVEQQPGIQALTTEVAKAIAADATFGPRFASVDMARFRDRLGAFLCHAVAGPCTYDGPLSDAWRGVTLDDDEFVALMEVLITGMNEAQLPQQEQNDLIDLLMQAHEAEVAAAPPAPTDTATDTAADTAVAPTTPAMPR